MTYIREFSKEEREASITRSEVNSKHTTISAKVLITQTFNAFYRNASFKDVKLTEDLRELLDRVEERCKAHVDEPNTTEREEAFVKAHTQGYDEARDRCQQKFDEESSCEEAAFERGFQAGLNKAELIYKFTGQV